MTALLVAFIRSTTAIAETRAVSLTSVIASLTIGGSVAFMVCGRMMSNSVCLPDSPSACAASYWPLSMLLMPPLYISAKYEA